MAIKSFMHIGIYTYNVDKSVDFYTKILGFITTWRGNVMLPGGEVKVATVTLNNCAIELVTPLDCSRINHVDGALQHLALEVDNLEETIADLMSKDIAITEAMSEISYEDGLLHCFIRGPEKERIELVQRLNKGSV